MSTYLGRIGPLMQRGFPFPGRMLLVFDDTLVVVRASGLESAHAVGSDSGNLLVDLISPLILGIGRHVGLQRNQAILDGSLSPDELTRSRRATWSVKAPDIIEARLMRPRDLSGNRRLVLRSATEERIFRYDSIDSPDAQVKAVLWEAIGDRFHCEVNT